MLIGSFVITSAMGAAGILRILSMKAEESPLLEIAACSGNILVSYVVKSGGRVPIYFKNCPRRGRSVMNTMGERRRHNDGLMDIRVTLCRNRYNSITKIAPHAT